MRISSAILVVAAANAVQGKDLLPWIKRRADAYVVTSTPQISEYVTAVETICTSTSTITLPPVTGEYPCYATISSDVPCTDYTTYHPTPTTTECPQVTKICDYGGCYSSTISTPCPWTLPGSTETNIYDCPTQTVSEYPCETVSTPTSESTSTYQCTTTVTSSTTIYKKITITDTRTLTVPSPTTTTDLILLPTTIVTTLTEDGTTRTMIITRSETHTRDVLVPTTILSTIIRDGTTQIATVTTTSRELSVQPGTTIIQEPVTVSLSASTVTQPPVTILSTIERSGSTIISTIVEPGTIISLEPSTVTATPPLLPPSTVTQPPVTILSTIERSGSTIISTVVLPGTIITLEPSTVTATPPLPPLSTVRQPPVTIFSTQPPETILSTITRSGSTITFTVVQPGTIITLEPSTITSTAQSPPPSPIPPPPPPASEPPACYSTGSAPTADPAGCDGRNCAITIDENAFVHWGPPATSKPPILVEVRFENVERSLTCITTSCDTAVFDREYKTTLSNCAFPPCPSNTVDAACNVVVGPIQLQNGQTTSVSLIGPSGWNINIGPTATASDIGRCGPGGTQCIAAASTTFSNIVYTGSVISSSTFDAALGTLTTNYALPQLPDYFPPGDILGDCTTVVLTTPTPTSSAAPRLLLARQSMQKVLGNGGSKLEFWENPTGTRNERIRVVDQPATTESSAAPRGSVNLPATSTLQTSPALPTSELTAPTALPSLGSSVSSAVTEPTGSPIVAPPPSSTADFSIAAPQEIPPSPSGTQQQPTPTFWPTSSPSGPESTVTITRLPASEESALSELESLRTGISTFTGDLGNFICEVLGCTFLGSTITGTVAFPPNSTTTSDAAVVSTTGAAIRERAPHGWLEFAPMLPVVAGVFG